MLRDDRNLTGPVLCILVCLFVLSVTASRSWQHERDARPENSDAAPQITEPVAVARNAEPNETASNETASQETVIGASDTNDPDAMPAPYAESELAEIPAVVAAPNTEPYNPGRFAAAKPAERYAGQPILVPADSGPELERPTAPKPEAPAPENPTLAHAAAPHDAVAELSEVREPVPIEPIPAEPQPALASLPDRAGPALLAVPRPVAEPIDQAAPIDQGIRERVLPELVLPDQSAQHDAQTAGSPWPEPQTLLDSMAQLVEAEIAPKWATETVVLLRDLESAGTGGAVAARQAIEQLRGKLREVDPLAVTMSNSADATKLRRVGHALLRRIDIWERATAVDESAAADSLVRESPSAGGREQLSLALAQIDAITAGSPEGEAWRDYLMFDALRDWSAKHPPANNEPMPRDLAQEVYSRLTQVPVSVAQREFIASEPMTVLRTQLRPWANEPVSTPRLLVHLEQYERTRLVSDARRLAADCFHLSHSDDRLRRELAGRLQTHYRNANLRIAVTDVLMNRLIPEREPEYESVRDRVLDVPVRGKSMTSTEVAIRLVPDPRRVRLTLEVKGRVATTTRSTSGSITFYSDGDAVYTARKPIDVDLAGISTGRAEVRVSNDIRLRRMETDFDEIPLVGSLVQEVARGQHESNHDEAKREIRGKMAAKARKRIDTEADERFGRLSDRLRDRVIDPLEALALEPTIIAAETSEQRITMRLRLAGNDQLASHTPRPRAPGGSLASMQVHQSAVNNLVDRLELAGTTYTLKELALHLASRLNRPPFWTPDPATEDVAVTFAERDPLMIRFEEGRLEIGLAIARLRSGSRSWKEFEVRAFYRPEVDGRHVKLVRDGVVQLIGKRMSMGSRIAVRGIFAKTFSKNRPWELTPEKVVEHPKLSDLIVTQFTMEDGWLGVALGPDPTVVRTALVR